MRENFFGESRKLCIFFAVLFFPAAELLALPPQNVIFSEVSASTITASWTLDTPANEQPLAAFSEAEDFSTVISSQTFATGVLTITYDSLFSNNTYYFKVKVSTESDAAYVSLSTATKPSPPQNPVISNVYFSSCSFSWDLSNNSANSVYYLQAAKDAAYTVGLLTSTTTSLSYDLSSLQSNTTYYIRGKTLGRSQPDSAYSYFGSTATLSQAPSSPAYSLIVSTKIVFSWNQGTNPSWTRYDLVISTDNFSNIYLSTNISAADFTAAPLAPNTTYYAKLASYNWAGTYSDYLFFPATITYAAVPSTHATTFPSRSDSAITVQWTDNDNPPNTEYYVLVSTASNFTGMDKGLKIWQTSLLADITLLDPGTTYYFGVRARDSALRESSRLDLGQEQTLTGADLTPPSVINLQGGDDAWRGSESGSYSVFFNDMGSKLSKFAVKATTGPDFSGTLLADWTNTALNINAEDFDTPWQLPLSVFQSIPENTTAYISVMVFDNNSNVNTTKDVFYVKRDTTLPQIDNYAVSPGGWLSSDPGPVFDVDFADALSGLSAIQYSASRDPGSANGNILGWTAIDTIISSPAYAANWGVTFASLEDSVTNYISVKAIDAAGNLKLAPDVFKILKNTRGPVVTIASPSPGFVSSLSNVTGSTVRAVETAAVAKTEITLYRRSDGKYWSASDYDSPAPVWLLPSAVETWSLDVSSFPFVNRSSYSVIGRALDVNSNYSNPYTTSTFTVDADTPAVYLSTPADSSSVYDFDLASGTASDFAGGAGIWKADLAVKRVLDGKWWNFFSNSWSNTEVSTSIETSGDWTFAPNEYLRGNFLDSKQYAVKVYSRDAAWPANASAAFFSTFTFYDTVPPGQPQNVRVSSNSQPGKIDLSWQFPGDDGTYGFMALGGFAIQYSTYAGFAFSTSAAQVLISTADLRPPATSWYTISSLGSGATYYFRLWFSDDAGLWSAATAETWGISGEGLENQIAGRVRNSSGSGITGVFVEAIDTDGRQAASSYTLDDGDGSYALSDLNDGLYRIQATWIENGIASAVSKDQIPMGYNDADFVISTDYQLSSIVGYIPLSAARPALTLASAGRVFLYSGSSLLVSKEAAADGYFRISNLFPGIYRIKFSPSETGYEVVLKKGESFVFTPTGLMVKSGTYVYPNPASSSAFFRVQTDGAAAQKEISVFSIDGRLVKKITETDAWSGSDPYTFEWDLSSVPSGVYLCVVKLKSQATGETGKKILKLGVIR